MNMIITEARDRNEYMCGTFIPQKHTLLHIQCDLREFIKPDLCTLAAQFPTVYWALTHSLSKTRISITESYQTIVKMANIQCAIILVNLHQAEVTKPLSPRYLMALTAKQCSGKSHIPRTETNSLLFLNPE